MASVDDIIGSINETCRKSGGIYSDYSCKTVSWDDAERGTVGGQLSCWGANITDTRLWAKNGTRLFTVRSDNWNEKLGKVSADQVAMIIGNQIRGGGQLEPITLKKFLKNAGTYASYANVPKDTELFNELLDTEISIRFQTTFLPVPETPAGKLEFVTEAYNYNTGSDSDPRNAVVLCTTQGFAFQQDGAGAKKLFHHSVDKDGKVYEYWLEAERTKHEVGGAQTETEEERAYAVANQKATAAVIGIEAMGTRFNALMTIQIPLKQKEVLRIFGSCCLDGAALYCNSKASMPKKKKSVGLGFNLFGSAERKPVLKKSIGISNAARVSRGSQQGQYSGMKADSVKRDSFQHITITVVLYNTVVGGVPSWEDVRSAIDDMENLYSECKWTGKLGSTGANFMKDELTVKNLANVMNKVSTQPYAPDNASIVKNGTSFPRD